MKFYRVLIFFVSIAVVQSCKKPEVISDIPVISFQDLRTFGQDSALIRLQFQDGDGNFGINNSELTDTSSIFHECPNNFNLFCEYYEKRNGEWIHIPIDPCEQVPFYYSVPWIQPSGQNKTQKGEILVRLVPAYYLPGSFDTCRFEVYIKDRKMNTSNRVVSSVFLKP
jgi:hypothetical protein